MQEHRRSPTVLPPRYVTFVPVICMILNETQAHSRWLLKGQHQTQWSSNYVYDSIDAYLTEPPVPPHEINNAGGILQYWEKHAVVRPHLSRMALDYLTAPGESE